MQGNTTATLAGALIEIMERAPASEPEYEAAEIARKALIAAVEASGYSLSGPTDVRAAEHGEPAWVCAARAAIAEATAQSD